MKTEIINTADQNRLEQLSKIIEDNYGTLSDYQEFENIVKKYPELYKKITEQSAGKGIYSIEQLYKKNKKPSSSNEGWIIAGLLGAIIGITLGAIYLSRRNTIT
ncbi:MAG: hypothetical protein COZ21_00110 [Bacteroidetes bacterium CG_4_10_14_3_um_filter_31_20]|nr:hypothetical protein [Bacteroidota bacterium]PIX33324.1 MAG: hypothetical protein COZ59_09540 [Bacteroidetes bacterium CG_4_8_14_3_um_filter_31_14]PIY07475.1 MAG: hypothetical protein COZ21_00110 [Bacteroidetes bacterium CG_4_10_14_3_um_filter_31_20]